jgi:hypothetical protein
MKKLILITAIAFIGCQSFAQNATSIRPIDMGYYTFSTSTHKTIDSSGENNEWFISNYRKVPANGLFVDTVVMKSKKGNYRIIEVRVFVDRKRIIMSRSWGRYDQKNLMDFDIDKQYFQN